LNWWPNAQIFASDSAAAFFFASPVIYPAAQVHYLTCRVNLRELQHENTIRG
jgi:hypothetical protein